MRTCGQCRFSKPIPKDLKSRYCHGAPPMAVAIPTPKGVMVQMLRPIVAVGDEECSLFKPRVISVGAVDGEQQDAVDNALISRG